MNRFWSALRTLCLLTLFSQLSACGGNSGNNSTANIVRLKGDPRVFIANTQGNTESGIPVALLSDEDVLWGMDMTIIRQEPQLNYEEALQTQSVDATTTMESYTNINATYRLSDTPDSNSLFSLKSETFLGFQLKMREDAGRYLLEQAVFQDQFPVTDLKIEHYSVKNDQSAFSILVSGVFQGKLSLLSFVLTRHQNTSLLRQTLDLAYNYVYGKGVSIAWNQSRPLVIQICQSQYPTLDSWASEALMVWSPPLQNRLSLRSQLNSRCPHFSDLNTATVQHIQGWVDVEGSAGQLAVTASSPNLFSKEIIDSDIFIQVDEWEESFQVDIPNFRMSEESISNYWGALRAKYLGVLSHEFGHVLGLHHKFDGTPSLMSYEPDRKLEAYDIEAIQALYPRSRF